MKINETGARWLRQNGACNEGREWAIAECATLAEVWVTARPDWLVWVATRESVLDDRTLWLFACWCAEQALPHWIAAYPDDRRPQVAIETRRRWIDGNATDDELEAAGAAAWAAARAAGAAAWAAGAAERAAGAAARAAGAAAGEAERAAWAAAGAAWAAERAAGAAAGEAERAAGAAAGEAQAKWLRDNATPVFPDAQTSPDLEETR